MRNFKKFVSLIFICVMVMGISGCGEKQATDYPAGSDAQRGSEIAFTTHEREVTADEYRYYVVKNAVRELYANADFDGNFTAVNWGEKAEDGKTLAERIEEKAKDELLGDVLLANLGESKGVALSGDEKEQADIMMQQFIDGNSEEELMLEIGQTGILSKQGFKKVYELSNLRAKVEEDIETHRDKYIGEDLALVLENYKSDEVASAQHILIMNDSKVFDAPRVAIEEILIRAKFGENFEALMEEYNEDPGESSGGYTFGRGVMVPEFEEAAFALGYNEISDVVESEYGYHIIKRIVGTAELCEYLKTVCDIEKNTEVTEKNSADKVMTDVYNVIQKIKGNQK